MQRTIPYNPALVKLIGSVNATIFLCYLLNITIEGPEDGWVRKTNAELAEDTGLSFGELRASRNKLSFCGVVEEKYFRSEGTNAYKVRVSMIDMMWGQEYGKAVSGSEVDAPENPAPPSITISKLITAPMPVLTPKSIVTPKPIVTYNPDVTPKPFIPQASVHVPNAQLEKVRQEKNIIKGKIENKLKIICDDRHWQDFISFVRIREERHQEPIEKYLEWALVNGFDPVYWTPAKMKTTYPRAFMNKTAPVKNKHAKPVEYKEKICAPMPEELKVKQILY